jgi:hypothetical protein
MSVSQPDPSAPLETHAPPVVARDGITVVPMADGRYPDAAHLNAFLRQMDANALGKPFGLIGSATHDQFAVFPAVFDVNETEISHHDTIIVRRGNKLFLGVVVRAHNERPATPPSPAALTPTPASASAADPLAPAHVKRHRSHSPCQ